MQVELDADRDLRSDDRTALLDDVALAVVVGIRDLVAGLTAGLRHQVLLGATGTGKTFTIANVIQQVQRPTLVLAHNKTLAAQLYAELKEFFPENAVEYFVSYFDYYQPEAYLPRSDTYIEKDSSRNDEIDQLRHAATKALFERRDTIIVASVSCIYGLGAPVDYGATVLRVRKAGRYRRDAILRHLVDLQYQRNDATLGRAKFRVRGDTLEVQPAGEETILRVEFFGDEVEREWVATPEQVRGYMSLTTPASLPAGMPNYFLDEATANSSGLTRPIAQGGLVTAIGVQLVTSWAGRNGRVRSVDANFRRSVFHGDRLHISALVTDVADEVRLDTGREWMGLMYALTIGTTKIASGLSALTFVLLAAIGYQAKEGAVNTPAAIEALQLVYIVGPIVFVMLAGACFIGYRLTPERHAEIRRQLEEREREAMDDPGGALESLNVTEASSSVEVYDRLGQIKRIRRLRGFTEV